MDVAGLLHEDTRQDVEQGEHLGVGGIGRASVAEQAGALRACAGWQVCVYIYIYIYIHT